MDPQKNDSSPPESGVCPVEPLLSPTLHNPPPIPPNWPRENSLADHGYDPDRVYGVSRRFSLATVMVMMAGASLILAGLNPVLTSLNAPGSAPVVGGTIVLLCVATAIGQMFLFGGKNPRNASFVVGAAFCGLAPLLIWAALAVAHIPSRLNLGWTIIWMFWGIIFGALPGYLAGCLVAGVLLVMDLTELVFARWRKAREPDDDPWPPPKNPLT